MSGLPPQGPEYRDFPDDGEDDEFAPPAPPQPPRRADRPAPVPGKSQLVEPVVRTYIEELANRSDEIRFLRQFIERVLIGRGFETWVRFHIALQDYSHTVRDVDWRRYYLRAIAEAAGKETQANIPDPGVLNNLPIGTRDWIVQSHRRRPCV